MNRMLMCVLTVIWLVLAVAIPVGAQEATPSASPAAGGGDLASATAWLIDQQREDGAFAGFSGEPDPGTTVDAITALVAADHAGVNTGTSIPEALAYLEGGDVALVYGQTGVGQAAKLALALLAAGRDPRDFAMTNPVSIVEAGQNDETGVYGSGLYDHAYAMMALAATGSEVPASALDALAATQAENGGWSFDGSTDPAMVDSNTTSMVVQAMVATGNADHEVMAPALEFLESTITDDGAAYAPGAEADANSTALVLQAMLATGGETAGLEAALATFQTDSGAYFYQAADRAENLFSTVQAIPAAAGAVLPILPEGDATPIAIHGLQAA
ncbi:MAG TPA: prenyltransferase/squalene oxidase repeat-containing protein [Thermomicrobiales bacterium]|nr:prenyltransferase/squalene oxidase repeat-containing protein [Thermomicrobiales bacterium]